MENCPVSIENHIGEPPAKRIRGDGTFNEEYLKVYYNHSFPYDSMIKWVGKEKLPMREWCFVLENDVFCRYQSFNDADDFKAKVLASCPHRMETGPYYNLNPKQKDMVHPDKFYAIERDFVLDIDMDEYDDIRTCCQGAKVCDKCWLFVKAGALIIREVLEEDFGFTKMFFVFSGRRGLHCWVYDEAARKLNNEQRGAVAEYLQLINDTRNNIKTCKVNHKGAEEVHLLISRSTNTLMPLMDKIIEFQQPFNGKDSVHVKNLETCFKEAQIDQYWGECVQQAQSDSLENVSIRLWAAVKKMEETIRDREQKAKIRLVIQEQVLQFCFPRLDINVSKSLNHLLKIPFVVHPKTGKFCVPIFDIDNFEISQVPTLADYVADFQETGTAGCLQPYLDNFKKQLLEE